MGNTKKASNIHPSNKLNISQDVLKDKETPWLFCFPNILKIVFYFL